MAPKVPSMLPTAEFFHPPKKHMETKTHKIGTPVGFSILAYEYPMTGFSPAQA